MPLGTITQTSSDTGALLCVTGEVLAELKHRFKKLPAG